jgi:peptide/nickel transport system substrate-binding protein
MRARSVPRVLTSGPRAFGLVASCALTAFLASSCGKAAAPPSPEATSPALATPSSTAASPAANPASPAPSQVRPAIQSADADVFHPAHQPGPTGARPPLPAPAYGGRAVIHLERLPRSLNNVLENLGVLRRILLEVHETLLVRDPDTLALAPRLATAWTAEDVLHVPTGSARAAGATALDPGSFVAGRGDELVRGRLTESADAWTVETRAADGSARTATFAKSLVTRVERSTAITFTLRSGVRWHDGHEFDSRDVRFSLALFENPLVDCGERRNQYEKIVAVEAPDARTVRVWFDKQYYFALDSLGTELTLLPAHLYDLEDPDCETGNMRRAKEPGWVSTNAERAEHIHKNTHNREWVGLGPYRVTRFDDQGVQAERFDGYFEPANGGWLDTLVWRYVKDDAVAFQALVNGELDFFARVNAEDYFGGATESDAFKRRLYKGWFYSGNYWFVAWNLARPQLADVRVRRAIAQATDFAGFKRAFYKDLADQITGPWIPTKPEYDVNVRPLAFEPAAARALLEDAGWIDRDGDGVVDRDGTPLEIEFLCEAGNGVAKAFAAQWQQDLARIGVKLRLAAVDGAVVTERRKARDFDALASAWALTWENDPEQVWHSKWAAPGERGANFTGFADERCDALIERGQRELDPVRRAAVWRELHARIYELQPYLFAFSPPRKFAIDQGLRGVQLVLMDPNYVLRRWYRPAGTPGTRATRERQ